MKLLINEVGFFYGDICASATPNDEICIKLVDIVKCICKDIVHWKAGDIWSVLSCEIWKLFGKRITVVEMRKWRYRQGKKKKEKEEERLVRWMSNDRNNADRT